MMMLASTPQFTFFFYFFALKELFLSHTQITFAFGGTAARPWKPWYRTGALVRNCSERLPNEERH